MKKSKRTSIEHFSILQDAIDDAVINATDKEILDDYVSQGEDPKALANRIRNLIKQKDKEIGLARLKQAREQLDNLKNFKRSQSSISEKSDFRKILKDFISNQATSNENFTLAFREGDLSAMSDDEIKSVLEDLIDIGLLNEDNLKND